MTVRELTLGGTFRLAMALTALFFAATVIGFFLPHPRLAGFETAIDTTDFLREIGPVCAGAVAIMVLFEGVRSWRRQHLDMRWTVRLIALTLLLYGVLTGLLTSFRGV